MNENVFVFERSFEGNTPIPEVVGRIQVAKRTIRILFSPKGLVLIIPKSLKNDEHIIWYNDTNESSLGYFPGEKKKKKWRMAQTKIGEVPKP